MFAHLDKFAVYEAANHFNEFYGGINKRFFNKEEFNEKNN